MSAIADIFLHNAPGETRAVAVNEAGQPVRLFLERWGGRDEPAQPGAIVTGRLRNASPKDGGAFFELESKEQVFVRGPLREGLTEGGEALLHIRAGRRRGKLARAVMAREGLSISASTGAWDRWRARLPAPEQTPVHENAAAREAVAQGFDLALSGRVGLPGGGAILISRTPALTAVDVDTAGRTLKGSAGARAFSVNREAVAETARQLALRDLGGLAAIDCIAPIHGEAAQHLRSEFLASWKQVASGKAEALKPSRFGLLEAKLAWGWTPFEDRLLGEDGQLTGESELLGLLRDVERQAEAERSRFFSLSLSSRARSAYMARREQCDRVLQERFSGRVSIDPDPTETSMVKPS